MPRRSLTLILGAGTVALALNAQPATDTTVTGPTLGYTLDSAQGTIRPILGLPGAALLGSPVVLPVSARRVLLAPGSRYALVQEKEQGQWSVLPDLSDPSQIQPTASLVTDADLFAFSADGAALVLYSAAHQSVQVIQGLPKAPAVSRTIDLSAVPGLVSTLAVSNDGAAVLMAVSGDTGALLLLATGDGPPRQIATADRVSALAFIPGGTDALWADTVRNQIGILRDVTGAAEWRVLAAEADGVANPVAVGADETRIVAVMSGGRLLTFPRGTGDPQQFDCGCTATGLALLPGNARWRVTDGSDGPLWVLDSNAARLFFVPAGGSQ